MAQAPPGAVPCVVELFGLARMVAGQSRYTLALPRGATVQDALQALAGACPALVDKVVTSGGHGLMPGFILNRGGVQFMGSLGVAVREGDHLLVLSDQAGG